jgi:hypothetical protein
LDLEAIRRSAREGGVLDQFTELLEAARRDVEEQ